MRQAGEGVFAEVPHHVSCSLTSSLAVFKPGHTLWSSSRCLQVEPVTCCPDMWWLCIHAPCHSVLHVPLSLAEHAVW